MPTHAHYLAHADGMKAALSALENLDFWANYLARAEADGRTLAATGCARARGSRHVAQAPVAVLSAGQKRRVALARLLVAFRPLWLLDEPLTALDKGRANISREIMRDHLALGGMIIAATHEPLGLEDARELPLGGRPHERADPRLIRCASCGSPGALAGPAPWASPSFWCSCRSRPFAVGPDPNLLSRIGPAILWISALLATLLGLDRLFQADAEDGSLDFFHLAETPLELAVW